MQSRQPLCGEKNNNNIDDDDDDDDDISECNNETERAAVRNLIFDCVTVSTKTYGSIACSIVKFSMRRDHRHFCMPKAT
jgi:hypothetical protein